MNLVDLATPALVLDRRVLAYSLGNFPRTLALPEAVEHWSLTTLRALSGKADQG